MHLPKRSVDKRHTRNLYVCATCHLQRMTRMQVEIGKIDYAVSFYYDIFFIFSTEKSLPLMIPLRINATLLRI